MRITFLGTGTSHGVPVVGCPCPVCASTDQRDARYRSSILVESGDSRVVVDVGPEFRLQAIRARITRLDAVLLTHAHADHLHGLDDIRPLSWERAIPVYGNEQTLAEVRSRFSYAFREGQRGGGKPRFELLPVGEGTIAIGDIVAQPVPLLHGELRVSGWRFGKFAYLTDCSSIPDSSWALLEGVEVAAIDALRLRPHPTHFCVDEALAAARRIGLSRTLLTHITHDSSHEALEAYCREHGSSVGAEPAFDGLAIEL